MSPYDAQKKKEKEKETEKKRGAYSIYKIIYRFG